ncbi:hypothetical protein E1176_17900 [Fulvivirga sp. RKSG066]|uniref:GSCFA domain-containing protein n=1 Tax=Fulvivirga aurantia TaxID=2529383 RepID=UPI0012BCB4B1|nr:GSCFA domain-containing protein [Fulvivirga aurantia]MTI22911.1 hypothetical protein [Fulvivirga aurantia]
MFRTELTLREKENKVDHSTPIMTIGSCFSDCMGSRFVENKFTVLSNPFGTVYNPVSIANLLEYAHNNQQPPDHGYTESQELHAHFDFHSTFSHTNKELVLDRINNAISQTNRFLKQTDWLIITVGTAYIYERLDNGEIVANCHKLPSRLFNKRLLSERQITGALEPVLARLKKANPSLKVIITVSPVRHTKDTIEKNMLSKSTLRVASSTLAQNLDFIDYFPSYEIMMDDLRDYRFYKSDMIHPNSDAENYIWDKFGKAYFSAETQSLLKDWSKLRTAINHRPFNPASAKHQNFIKQTIDKLVSIQQRLDVSHEIDVLKKQLSKT